MKSKIMKSKLISTLQVCAFVFLTAAAFNANAEYYLVYPGSELYEGCSFNCGGCGSPCFQGYYQTPVHYFHYKSPRRHYSTGAEQMSEYAWVPSPEAP